MGAASRQLKPAVLGEDLAVSLSEIIARDDTYITARGAHVKVRENSSIVATIKCEKCVELQCGERTERAFFLS